MSHTTAIYNPFFTAYAALTTPEAIAFYRDQTEQGAARHIAVTVATPIVIAWGIQQTAIACYNLVIFLHAMTSPVHVDPPAIALAPVLALPPAHDPWEDDEPTDVIIDAYFYVTPPVLKLSAASTSTVQRKAKAKAPRKPRAKGKAKEVAEAGASA